MAKREAQIEFILSELRSGNLTRASVMAKIVKKWQVSERTFDRYWKQAHERHQKLLAETQNAINQATISTATENALNGIKTKNQRIAEKQADIDLIREAVKKGTTSDTSYFQGEPISHTRNLTEVEKATMLKRAAEIESEISKIEGDYAAMKSDVTIKKLGKDLEDESYV